MSVYSTDPPKVYMRHPETGGAGEFAGDAAVVASYQAKGWVLDQLPDELNPDAPNTGARFPVTDHGPTVDQKLDQETTPKKAVKAAPSKKDHEGDEN